MMPEPFECPICKGLGSVRVNSFVDGGTTRPSTCHACKGKGTIPPSADDYKDALTTALLKLEAYKTRGDQHAESLRAIRDMARAETVDLERIVLWCSDSLSGYTEPLESTLLKAYDERNNLQSELKAAADVELMRFYQTDTVGALVQALSQHVEKLQDKLQRAGCGPQERIRPSAREG
jgi:hypothetical protein